MWSDRETTEDCLGYAAYVDTLKAVALASDIAPVTIGVFGDWGSGKTSLMRMLQHALPTDEEGTLSVWFNPWQFEGKDEVQTALIHSILDVLEKRKSLLDDAKEALKKLKSSASMLKLAKMITKTVVTMTPDIGGFLDCFSDPTEKLATTMREFNSQFAAYLESQKINRLVVFIDDLDRCEPQRALELFETIQLFLASDRCAFVIGADAEKIRLAISQRYTTSGDHDGVTRDYLEKVIQVPFCIPYQSPTDVEIYIHSLIVLPYVKEEAKCSFRDHVLRARAESQDITKSVSQWLSDNQDSITSPLATIQLEVSCVLPHLGTIIRGLKGNPRQIKRFLNIYKLRRTLAETNGLTVDNSIMVKLLAMEYTWPRAFEDCAAATDPATGHSAVLEELYAFYRGDVKEEPSSKIIGDLLVLPGLKDFLQSKPLLEKVVMAPYLFLAQTGLEKRARVPASSTQELAAAIVSGITSGDKIRVRIAVNKSKDLDEDSLSICIAQCIPMMFDSDAVVSTQTIIGIDELLARAVQSVGTVATALEEADSAVLSIGARVAVNAMLKRLSVATKEPALKERIAKLSTKYGMKGSGKAPAGKG